MGGATNGAKRIGPFLCWAVVFADIGTSQYYVPGILYRHVGTAAAAFVALTGLCFILLARKYVAITSRYAEGGGVVSAASEAFGPLLGVFGGMLITVDYFLTSAISTVSAFEYVASLTHLGGWQLPLTCAALVLLGALNMVGIKESAMVSAVMAVAALIISAVVGVVNLQQAGVAGLRTMLEQASTVGHGGVLPTLQGFAGAWLAFSGLESMSQLSPALRDPKAVVARRSMLAVTITILATSPVLTALSMVRLDHAHSDPDQFISDLAFAGGGTTLRILLVVTAAALLLFASNTAIIGCYHVFVALARERFLPNSLARVSYRFGTPHNAIAVATVIPIVIILATRGSLSLLGDLYAFGLLGAFTLSSVSMDVVAWREKKRQLGFAVGILTTVLVAVAWMVNLVYKKDATLFGASIVALGMGLALAVKRGWLRGEMNLVPFISAEAAEVAAEHLPTMRKILTLREAQDIAEVYPAQLLVPVRGFRPKLMDAAIQMAQDRGYTSICLLCVDEIPGLYFPPKVGPSGEAVNTLTRCADYLQKHGVEAVPVWRMAHDASTSIASAAGKLGVQAVMIGTTERTALWTVLRGSVARGLGSMLPPGVDLVASDIGGGKPAPAKHKKH